MFHLRKEKANFKTFLVVARCSKCKENCTAESEAIQCDLCYAWLHALCDGISSELYSSLNNIFATLSS